MSNATKIEAAGSPLIIAHRGASAAAPENTRAAFRRAMEAGADGVEFDVRLAKDGVPVVIHDAALMRLASIPTRVSDLDSAELSKVDVGSWFNRAQVELADPAFANETVPTLAEVLELLAGVSGKIYIELKCDGEAEMHALTDAVAAVIGHSRLLPQMIVKSFRLGVIPRIRCAVPEVRTAALFAPQMMRYLRKEKYLINIAREFGADHLSLHRSLVSRKLVRKAEAFGLPVTAWTVNKTHWFEKAARNALYAVITNDPAKLLEVRNAASS
jgi:glycerophosphoryl diester phosphodiesterase